MIIEGRNAVLESLKGDVTIDRIYILRGYTHQDVITRIKNSGVSYQFVDKPALDRMSKSNNHQGIIAAISDYKYVSVEQIIEQAYRKGEQPLILILDGIEDPHNLGNIIRTAECMGVDGIIIPKNRASSVNETVIRVSAGAAAHIKICKVTNINHEIELLKGKGFWIFACELGGVNVMNTNMNGPIAIVMGGENTGVRNLTLKLCDGVVTIPMFGKTNSLNVATATAMILYEVNRQRQPK